MVPIDRPHKFREPVPSDNGQQGPRQQKPTDANGAVRDVREGLSQGSEGLKTGQDILEKAQKIISVVESGMMTPERRRALEILVEKLKELSGRIERGRGMETKIQSTIDNIERLIAKSDARRSEMHVAERRVDAMDYQRSTVKWNELADRMTRAFDGFHKLKTYCGKHPSDTAASKLLRTCQKAVDDYAAKAPVWGDPNNLGGITQALVSADTIETALREFETLKRQDGPLIASSTVKQPSVRPQTNAQVRGQLEGVSESPLSTEARNYLSSVERWNALVDRVNALSGLRQRMRVFCNQHPDNQRIPKLLADADRAAAVYERNVTHYEQSAQNQVRVERIIEVLRILESAKKEFESVQHQQSIVRQQQVPASVPTTEKTQEQPERTRTGEVHLQSIAEFSEMIQNARQPILVKFGASWCKPCKNPLLVNAVKAIGQDTLVVHVDVDAFPQLKQQYRVGSLPTLMSFRNGRPLYQLIGAHGEADLRRLLPR